LSEENRNSAYLEGKGEAPFCVDAFFLSLKIASSSFIPGNMFKRRLPTYYRTGKATISNDIAKTGQLIL